MTRTFLHSFDPPADSPVTDATVDLAVADIEDAGIREVLQTPGTAYGAWFILDALLTPTGAGTPFIFKEPLGQAREVKVALSGLFGRFVVRAYLERFFNLSIFAHLGSRVLDCRAERPLMAFVLVLSYSRYPFLRFYLNASLASLIRGHVAAFSALGGTARTLLHDDVPRNIIMEYR